ncbi:bestrophin family protein [Algoriphagus sp.]|uniref:bestrophin family protein n=1 Tax=Algoriphagus sp. TaxID=1872435 RepID=UPI0025DAF5C3|nr:bestrophin family ion channel [Algoriphagus sp.]
MIVHNKFDLQLVLKFSLKNILFSIGVTSIAVFLHFEIGMKYWQIPITIIATLGTALAIILGFRNGSAYERWWEARKIWGGLVNDSRTYCRQVLSMVNLNHAIDQDPSKVKEIQKDLITTHLSFINSLRLQLRGNLDENEWNEKVYKGLDKVTFESIRNKSNKASQLLIQQGKKLEHCLNTGFIEDFRHMNMDNTLTRLSDFQGKSERIKHTPFPKAYEIFNRILLGLFILFLPFSLLPIFSDMNGWWLVFPVTVLISWVFYGIHQMGLLMANPFENFRWDVPLDALCNTIEIDLLEAIEADTIPKKLIPNEEGILM